MNATHSIWVEKYRPTTLDNYIGNDSMKAKVGKFIAEGDVPHILLSGPPGTGKTTVAKIIVKNIECESLYINASDENNVDTVRNKIRGFASTVGFTDLKVIILDECLDENTLVWVLREGSETAVAIKDVNPLTDLVKSWNTTHNRIEWRQFDKFDKGLQDVYELELENGEVVICTADHKWYVRSDTGEILVVKTSELDTYSHILSPEVELKTVKITKIKKLDVQRRVYDLSVQGNHNFFIGRTQTLTHNCDYMTPNAQAALRNVMETFSRSCRFILTCNYVERIIDPIISRTQQFHVVPPNKIEVAKHLAGILKQEGVSYKPDDIKLLVDAYYPDIRKIIGEASLAVNDGKLSIDAEEVVASDIKLRVIELLGQKGDAKKRFTEIRQLFADAGIRDFTEFYSLLYSNVDTYAKGNVSQVILHIAEGQKYDAQVVNKEINMMATIINILQTIG
jgi:DNA polymerase III delta prime subunit